MKHYLEGYATVGELLVGLSEYFALYNSERPHQSLKYKTPDVVYTSASGGGMLMVDKYGKPTGATGLRFCQKPKTLLAALNPAVLDG